MELIRQSAAQGNTNALKNLGICHELGRGVTQNYQEARRLYTSASLPYSTLGGKYLANVTYLLFFCSLLPIFHMTAKTCIPGLPKGCAFPDVMADGSAPEPLRHRFFFGGSHRSFKATDFEFTCIKIYNSVAISHTKVFPLKGATCRQNVNKALFVLLWLPIVGLLTFILLPFEITLRLCRLSVHSISYCSCRLWIYSPSYEKPQQPDKTTVPGDTQRPSDITTVPDSTDLHSIDLESFLGPPPVEVVSFTNDSFTSQHLSLASYAGTSGFTHPNVTAQLLLRLPRLRAQTVLDQDEAIPEAEEEGQSHAKSKDQV